MARKRQSLDGWITEALIDGDREGQCKAFSLVHVTVSGSERELHAIRFNGSKQWTGSELALVFRGKAESYAQDLPGTQTFCLLAFYDGDAEPARHPFTISGEPDPNGTGLTTEAPTPQGVLAMSMRHVEFMYRTNDSAQRRVTDTLQESNRILAAENRTLQKELQQAYAMTRELVLGRLTEEHKFKLEQIQAEQKANDRQLLFNIVPPLINNVVGREVFPQSTADTALIEMIAKSLDRNTLEKIATLLPPEVLAPLMGRFEQVLQAASIAQDQAHQALAENNVNPEDDAAGGSDE